ncbi:MAG TPA: NAD-dependent epimerase/dehydratase family protein [Stellaceae bacterium]|jgi:UDP-glucose 4-epimerase|nr:NAD-dependent epimerase/dehydratase family protein [Stellaceae bacterium]
MADGFAFPRNAPRRSHAPARLPYLVTGGCGFIGARLTAALAARGDAIRVLDDLSNGLTTALPRDVEFIQGDIADPVVVRSAMQGVAGCFHLAGFASVPQSQRQWLSTHRTNLTGTINVLDASHRERPANPVPVVYASTAAIYGDRENALLAEWLPAKPISSYGADYVGTELHARIARAVHGVPTIGLRLFNVYGPGQSAQAIYASAIAVFCDALKRRQPITIFGDGGQIRDFVYIDDAVEASLAAMEHLPLVPEVLNVATGRGITMLDLIDEIAAQCGIEPEINFAPARLGDARFLVGDPGRAKDYLGYRAETDLATGIAMTLRALDEALV